MDTRDDSRRLPYDHEVRIACASRSLDGLSLGDAFGERFLMHPEQLFAALEMHELPRSPWRWTDDTMMGVSVLEVLRAHGGIEQDVLASAFARRYVADPTRGYGPGAHRLLRALAAGGDWRTESFAAFDGAGSYGNGAAMRVAPVGAYFADDLAKAAAEAERSAQITHAHAEGIAGAVAVGVAAACAASAAMTPELLVRLVLEHTPHGETRDGIVASQQLPAHTPTMDAARTLGSGLRASSQDTVPFIIWCAARHLAADFATAVWDTLSGLGDLDTTCAMVGGILALRPQCYPLPEQWLEARERLPPI